MKESKNDVKQEGKPKKFAGVANIENISFNCNFEIISDSPKKVTKTAMNFYIVYPTFSTLPNLKKLALSFQHLFNFNFKFF